MIAAIIVVAVVVVVVLLVVILKVREAHLKEKRKTPTQRREEAYLAKENEKLHAQQKVKRDKERAHKKLEAKDNRWIYDASGTKKIYGMQGGILHDPKTWKKLYYRHFVVGGELYHQYKENFGSGYYVDFHRKVYIVGPGFDPQLVYTRDDTHIYNAEDNSVKYIIGPYLEEIY